MLCELLNAYDNNEVPLLTLKTTLETTAATFIFMRANSPVAAEAAVADMIIINNHDPMDSFHDIQST